MRHRPLCRTLMTAVPCALLLALAGASTAEVALRVKAFRSVTLRNGGEVLVRHGASQRVTLLDGTPECVRAAVDGDRLVIDWNHGRCPEGHRVTVEIEVPELDGLAVHDGGIIQCLGGFPRQADLRVEVAEGGTIDLRAMSVDRVKASVRDGGRIFTTPQEALVADVAHGGAVTYWGSPRVARSVEHGGVVSKGRPADAAKPIHEFDPASPVVPPVPPLPPSPALGRGNRTTTLL